MLGTLSRLGSPAALALALLAPSAGAVFAAETGTTVPPAIDRVADATGSGTRIFGHAEARAVVEIRVDGRSFGIVVAAPDGTFDLLSAERISPGVHQIEATDLGAPGRPRGAPVVMSSTGAPVASEASTELAQVLGLGSAAAQTPPATTSAPATGPGPLGAAPDRGATGFISDWLERAERAYRERIVRRLSAPVDARSAQAGGPSAAGSASSGMLAPVAGAVRGVLVRAREAYAALVTGRLSSDGGSGTSSPGSPASDKVKRFEAAATKAVTEAERAAADELAKAKAGVEKALQSVKPMVEPKVAVKTPPPAPPTPPAATPDPSAPPPPAATAAASPTPPAAAPPPPSPAELEAARAAEEKRKADQAAAAAAKEAADKAARAALAAEEEARRKAAAAAAAASDATASVLKRLADAAADTAAKAKAEAARAAEAARVADLMLQTEAGALDKLRRSAQGVNDAIARRLAEIRAKAAEKTVDEQLKFSQSVRDYERRAAEEAERAAAAAKAMLAALAEHTGATDPKARADLEARIRAGAGAVEAAAKRAVASARAAVLQKAPPPAIVPPQASVTPPPVSSPAPSPSVAPKAQAPAAASPAPTRTPSAPDRDRPAAAERPRPARASGDGAIAAAEAGRVGPRTCSRRAGHMNRTGRYYIVRRGDTLWSIADARYHNGSRYTLIKSANGSVADADMIYPCERLVLPRAGAR